MSSTLDTGNNDPSTIERNSDEIRADMNATLDALERKLSPQQLVDRSLSMVKDHGGEFVTNLGNVAKANPVPLLLTAVGLVWLIAANSRSNRTSIGSSYEDYGTDDYGYEEMGLSGTEGAGASGTAYGSTSGSRMQGLKARVRDSASHLKESAAHLKDRVQQSASAAKDRIKSSRERMHTASDGTRTSTMQRVRNISQQTRYQAIHARDSFTTMLNEQPIAVGALGVVIGAIIGAAMPSTRTEDRMLGSARDRALERAKQMGQQQYEALRERANQLADDVNNRAQRAMGTQSAGTDTTGTDTSTDDLTATGATRESGSFRGESRPIGRA